VASSLKIKIGDTIEVISGRDRGTRGEVMRLLPRKRRVIVRGVNVRKKHQRQIQAAGRTMSPGIIQFEAPIHISNVMLICPKCDEPTRVGYKIEGKSRQRICRNCEAVV
jgi:large subunit ribosomal protein L24